MTIKKIAFLILLNLFLAMISRAQFRLPPLDVELKLQQSLFPGPGEDGIELFEATSVHIGGHVQITQHFAVGAFYSRSFRAMALYHNDQASVQDNKGALLAKGIDIRLSSGRAKKWRRYIAVSYSRLEIVEDNVDFRWAAKSSAFGANLGLMRKLGNRFYLNLIDIGLRVANDPPFWYNTDTDVILEARTGILYSLDRRK